ncbi:Uu.00g036150.m01.CDS01 [Anthostomella pinea]|uniref:Uu.00g036150.m01.CDS01 n=1 Tax=Anthostomella pinea TaxID=933095 RepID=A0AAI8YDI8_9PEZI|nr:Uu.00g036150.m01.CDS01 [Anthostomella pinea]
MKHATLTIVNGKSQQFSAADAGDISLSLNKNLQHQLPIYQAQGTVAGSLPEADPQPAAQTQLPATPKEVTATWLSSVLGTSIRSIELTKIQHGTASKLFYTVTYDDDSHAAEQRPTQLCLKGGFDPALVQKMPWVTSIYQREVEFFKQIAPTLDHMSLPRGWWAGSDSKQGIVVLDDLGVQGCTFGDPRAVWPVSRVLAGVEQLAALHAATWGAPQADYPGFQTGAGAVTDTVVLTLMQTFDAVVRGPDRPPVPAYLQDQARITAALEKHYAIRNPAFRCLLHGDARTGNTYLDAGSAPRFLDWQMIHVGSAFHDVAYFIGGALSVEDRRAHEWDIVDHYLDTLRKLGGPVLSSRREDVANEYRKSFLAGHGWIMCPYEMQPRECVYAMAARYAAALDDHKTLELVESLPDIKQDLQTS